jgi:hypothetical protein
VEAEAADQSSLRGVGSDAVVAAIGSIVVVAGVAVGFLRYVDPDGASAAQRAMEGPWGGLALGAVVAAPGVLVLLAFFDRPVLLLPAAIILVPLSFLSFAGILLPLLIPAGVLVAAYTRRSPSHPLRAGRTGVVVISVVALLLAAAISLFVHEDPRQYTTPTESGGTSDVITPLETLICLAFVTAAIATGWLAASPTDRRPAATPPNRTSPRRPASPTGIRAQPE